MAIGAWLYRPPSAGKLVFGGSELHYDANAIRRTLLTLVSRHRRTVSSLLIRISAPPASRSSRGEQSEHHSHDDRRCQNEQRRPGLVESIDTKPPKKGINLHNSTHQEHRPYHPA